MDGAMPAKHRSIRHNSAAAGRGELSWMADRLKKSLRNNKIDFLKKDIAFKIVIIQNITITLYFYNKG